MHSQSYSHLYFVFALVETWACEREVDRAVDEVGRWEWMSMCPDVCARTEAKATPTAMIMIYRMLTVT